MVLNIDLRGIIPSKKNSRINTKSGRSFPSKAYSAWHANAAKQILASGHKSVNLEFKYPVSVEIYFRFKTLQKADLSNKAESVMDLLVDNGIIADDSWKHVNSLSLTGYLDRECPGCYVIIKEQNETNVNN